MQNSSKRCLQVTSDITSQVASDIKKYRDEIFPRVVAAFREMSHGLFDLEVTIIPDVQQFCGCPNVQLGFICSLQHQSNVR